AQHGLIGAMSPIAPYDQRMTADRAAALAPEVTDLLGRLLRRHERTHLVLGKDYLRSIWLENLPHRPHIADGPIGIKLNYLHELLYSYPVSPKRSPSLPQASRPLYFLPDWDDFLDVDFDFGADRFSCDTRSARNEEHSIALMRPDRLCDGVLVSLAQN